MIKVIDLQALREPVEYAVYITHRYDGTLEVHVPEIEDDSRSRESVAWALRRAADAIEPCVTCGKGQSTCTCSPRESSEGKE